MLSKHTLALLTAGALLLPGGSALACATCGCTLSTDAATGYSTQTGWRLNLQYDYINQDQLRHDTGTASVVPVGNELEHQTKNHYTTTSLSYAPNRSWSVSLQSLMSSAITAPTVNMILPQRRNCRVQAVPVWAI